MSNSGTGASKRALVIDDEELVRRVVARLLRGMGFEIIEAGDGIDGIDVLESSSQEIHLVVCDGRMPGMTGPETFRSAHARLKAKLPTWIFLTGEESESRLRREMQAIMAQNDRVALVLKPYNRNELKALIARLVKE